MRRLGGEKIVFFTDGGPACASALKLLTACLAATDVRWRLVLGFHPKFVGVRMPGGTETWDAHWNRIIDPLRNRGLVLNIDASGDECALLADATASTFSTLLFRAACSGKRTITLWTREAKMHWKKSSGLSETPLMMMGYAPIVRPRSLAHELAVPAAALQLPMFDPIAAAKAIMAL